MERISEGKKPATSSKAREMLQQQLDLSPLLALDKKINFDKHPHFSKNSY
jgi:hypothetical protein